MWDKIPCSSQTGSHTVAVRAASLLYPATPHRPPHSGAWRAAAMRRDASGRFRPRRDRCAPPRLRAAAQGHLESAPPGRRGAPSHPFPPAGPSSPDQGEAPQPPIGAHEALAKASAGAARSVFPGEATWTRRPSRISAIRVAHPYRLVEVVVTISTVFFKAGQDSPDLVLQAGRGPRDRRRRRARPSAAPAGRRRAPGDADALALAARERVGPPVRTSPGSRPTRSSIASTRSAIRRRSQPRRPGTVATFWATVRWGNSPTPWST